MKYISILRGINVGGQKKIKMADLKSLYESLGFENVMTYIQSGNVIFDVDSDDKSSLKSSIETKIMDEYQFHVPIIIRTHNDIKVLIESCPLGSVDLSVDGTKVLVTFLSELPSENNITALQKYAKVPEKLWVKGKEVYLHCPNGYGRTKLNNTFLEKKLSVQATTRNWKTVQKLYELSL